MTAPVKFVLGSTTVFWQNDMLHILLRFRVHRVGISSDIEKAFHRVLLHESNRDFVRFLWLSDY
jgi:hypothetical protein